jgi:hypothetical protein
MVKATGNQGFESLDKVAKNIFRSKNILPKDIRRYDERDCRTKWCNDIQYNGNKYNDTQHSYTQNNNIKPRLWAYMTQSAMLLVVMLLLY